MPEPRRRLRVPRLRPMQIGRNISVATRLSLVALSVTLVSLLVAAAVGLDHGADLADEQADERLVAIGSSQATQVEAYLAALEDQVSGLARSPAIAEAIQDLGSAFDELGATDATRAELDRLVEHYRTGLLEDLEAVRGRPVSVGDVLPTTEAGLRLQAAYVVPPDEDTDPANVYDAGDGSTWSEVHAELHPTLIDVAASAGFADLYLIDARRDVVVYSVHKLADFATSLDQGPLSGSTLSAVVDEAEAGGDPLQASVRDFSRYAPVGDRPAAFVAAPVVADGTVVGAVAGRIGTEDLNALLTDSADWDGFGDTGETYLGSQDGTMRSDARPFVEDRQGYLDTATDRGVLTEDQRRQIALTGTTSLVQPVNEAVLAVAAAAGPGLDRTSNYLGVDVVTAFRPITTGDFGWVLFSEVAASEVDEPIDDYSRNLLIAVAIFVVALTFLAVRWSGGLVGPLRIASARLRAARTGSVPDEGLEEIPPNSPAEFTDLADDIDSMLARLETRRAEVHARSAERLDLLGRFLPPAVMRRVEHGERDVVDQISAATVVSVVLLGLGEIVRHEPGRVGRDLLGRLVDDVDVIAREHGLERLRLAGGAYVAACGTSRPFLDHAPRSVAFALAIRDHLAETAEREALDLAVGIGVDSGPVTIGITGGVRFVFDAWGPAVDEAARLSRLAGAGEVLVSEATRNQLPAGFTIRPYEGGTGTDGVAVVVDEERAGEATDAGDEAGEPEADEP